MRIGFNPHKDVEHEVSFYRHQVIIPVYIPNGEGYFKDSFTIFKRCIQSLLATVHDQTFITLVNNGSNDGVRDFLDALLREKKIHEVIHTNNIGKVNAVIKGLSGNNIPLVTIADADVLFLSGWQAATAEIFNAFPKAGIVGVVPQYKVLFYKCQNIIFSNLFSKRMSFIPVKDPESLQHFHSSIGWQKIDPELIQKSLGIKAANGTEAFVGTGHFMATYRKDIFAQMKIFHNYKLGGNSEGYIDGLALNKDLWRLTTTDNYAFHMGNIHEKWMDEIRWDSAPANVAVQLSPLGKVSALRLFIVNRIFSKIYANKYFNKWFFYPLKKLPADIAAKY